MLTYEAAKSAEGAAFTLQAGYGPQLPLVLDSVVPAQHRTPGNTGFSLFLKGTRGILCPQGIYVLENAALGRLEVFLVPIAQDAETGDFSYQVVFS